MYIDVCSTKNNTSLANVLLQTQNLYVLARASLAVAQARGQPLVSARHKVGDRVLMAFWGKGDNEAVRSNGDNEAIWSTNHCIIL